MQEEFRDVPGYEGLYQVSNLGSVKSLSRIKIAGKIFYKTKEIILKQATNTNKRLTVNLAKQNKIKTKLVHQLVAMAFLGHKPCGLKLVVDHIDDNYLNNRVENLQIVTQRFNVCKTQGNYSSKYKGVYWYKPRNKWKASITINNKKIYLGLFDNEEYARDAYQNKLKTIE